MRFVNNQPKPKPSENREEPIDSSTPKPAANLWTVTILYCYYYNTIYTCDIIIY